MGRRVADMDCYFITSFRTGQKMIGALGMMSENDDKRTVEPLKLMVYY